MFMNKFNPTPLSPKLFIILTALSSTLIGCAPHVRTTQVITYVPVPKDQAQREWLMEEREVRLKNGGIGGQGAGAQQKELGEGIK